MHVTLPLHRFSTTLLGSRALVGTLLQPHNLLLQQGRDGLSVQQVLEQHGFTPTPQALAALALNSSQVCRQKSLWPLYSLAMSIGISPLGFGYP